MMDNQARKEKWSSKTPMLIGLVAVVTLFLFFGVWGSIAKIAGAIVAPGMIQVESNRQVIQHPEGGVVDEILAKNGDLVRAGDVLVRLDDTLLRSELSILETQLVEIQARKARLIAERDDASAPIYSQELQNNPLAEAAISGQSRLFNARREDQAQQIAQIDEQITQIGEQIKGADAQLDATEKQFAFLSNDLENTTSLRAQGLAQQSQLSSLQRGTAQLAGQIGQIEAEIARLKGTIAELNIEKLRIGAQRREEALDILQEIEPQEAQIAERILALNARLERMDIRSPVNGVVYGSQVFALKSVISPAEPIMFVIPQDQPLIVIARVDNTHIDQVYIGQDATLRFTAFDTRSSPDVFGKVVRLSADVIVDEVTGSSYYQAELWPNEGELAKLEGQTLLPGMPVEVFIKTNERTPIAYLTKPLADYFNRAFRD